MVGSLPRGRTGDLVKLGEMRWRYRVCEEGESPRDEGIRVLEIARDLLRLHLEKSLAKYSAAEQPAAEQPAAELSGGGASRASTLSTDSAMRKAIREEWAAEYAEVLHGLGVARVIFNPTRFEDELIESLLVEAVELRTASGLRAQLAETLNAHGSLKQ